MLGGVQTLSYPSRTPGRIQVAEDVRDGLPRVGAAAHATSEGRAMQNEVYLNARRELAELVSPRAAQRVLDDALRASGERPETIEAAAMRKLLLGPVRRQLASVLPRSGLTRSLKRIANEVAKSSPHGPHGAHGEPRAARRAAPAATTSPAPPAPSTPPATIPDSAVKRSSVYLPDLPSLRLTPKPPTRSADPAPPRTTVPVPAAPAGVDAGLERRGAITGPATNTATATITARDGRLDAAAMDAAVRTFGALETVRQVVIVRGNAVALERGEAIDARKLPTLVRSTRHLLARGGDLRVFSLEHPRGVLFVFPFGADAIVVVTRPNVNIGAVLTARAALEEAA